ncbi:hypothetical protein X801_06801, partial [Opisthorchis viverrini]
MTTLRVCDAVTTTGLAHVVVSINTLIGLVNFVRQTALQMRANTRLNETCRSCKWGHVWKYSTIDHIGVVAMESPSRRTLQTCFVESMKVAVKI